MESPSMHTHMHTRESCGVLIECWTLGRELLVSNLNGGTCVFDIHTRKFTPIILLHPCENGRSLGYKSLLQWTSILCRRRWKDSSLSALRYKNKDRSHGELMGSEVLLSNTCTDHLISKSHL